VADTTIGLDGLEALQVARNFAAEVTFNPDTFRNNELCNFVKLFFAQGVSAAIRIQTSVRTQRLSGRLTDSINVTQRIRNFLIRGDLDSKNAWHRMFGGKNDSKKWINARNHGTPKFYAKRGEDILLGKYCQDL
jgi:hypothetical protein